MNLIFMQDSSDPPGTFPSWPKPRFHGAGGSVESPGATLAAKVGWPGGTCGRRGKTGRLRNPEVEHRSQVHSEVQAKIR